MGFFIGADLDWVARFHREGPVRRNGVIENRTGEYRRSGRGEARHEFAGGPAADTSNGQQQDGRRDLRQAPGTIASPLCKKMRDAQALRCAFVRYGKGSPQRFSLLGILRQPLALFGIRCEIGLDDRGAFRRQTAIDAGLQVVLSDRTARSPHLTLLNAAFRRRLLSSRFPYMCCRSRSRPRESRDITVPIGTPKTRAASS